MKKVLGGQERMTFTGEERAEVVPLKENLRYTLLSGFGRDF
jgi:hypothetical protein